MKLPEIIGGVVLLIGATAGTITWSDLRYALRYELAGLATQYQQQREDSIERQIFELEREKAKRGKLSEFEQREHQRLLRQRQQIKEEIKRLLRDNK